MKPLQKPKSSALFALSSVHIRRCSILQIRGSRFRRRRWQRCKWCSSGVEFVHNEFAIYSLMENGSLTFSGVEFDSVNVIGVDFWVWELESGKSCSYFRLQIRELSSFRAWPNMHGSKFSLYKMPMQARDAGQEYARLWGGRFGWPPCTPSEDKPRKALFFPVLSYYEESPGRRLLIATKILEGTHYVLHPNASAMFIVNVDETSVDQFHWSNDADKHHARVKHAFFGEGIANGYGFRYPGSKLGSLFVLENGILAFIWKESKAVLTLQRLDLQDLLKKGRRVPALLAIANFSYLTKSYSNVFAGLANMGTSLSSLRYAS